VNRTLPEYKRAREAAAELERDLAGFPTGRPE
jgi:hypothetical protein